jgi:inosose dehydratase
MKAPSRRDFLKAAGVLTAAGAVHPQVSFAGSLGDRPQKDLPFALGMASYTFRAYPLDQAIAMTTRLGLTRVTLKDMHLPMTLSEQDLRASVEKVRAAGLELASLGVIYMRSEEEVRHAFAYAKLAGVKMITGAPNEDLLSVVEQHVKATDIMVAIHNHGPDKNVYPSPEDAYSRLKAMDRRMGLCIDIGHTRRLGLDPAVEMGRGAIDIPAFLRTIMRLKYGRTLHFEYEKDQNDPLPGVAESVGYVRGVLATL